MEDKYPSLTDEVKIGERKDKLSDILEKRREYWNRKINELVLLSSDFNSIPELQVKLLSYRHELIDYLAGDLNTILGKSKTVLDKVKKNILLDVKTNYDYRLTSDKEKSIVIDADSRVCEEMVELIESQMFFIKETIKTLDNLGYNIKNTIDFRKFISGGNI